MLRPTLFFAIGLASAMVIATGCSKNESETIPTPVPPVPPKTAKSEAPRPEPLTSPAEIKPAAPAKPSASLPSAPPAAQEESPAQLAAEVGQLERDYYNT
ncbi:MAG TPA: hypothetical protein VLZ30_07195, partial [Verrucomicrobiae bacterium]|nr:hypothetical protein [Verrucomicrobiae bacterium]